MVRNALIDPHSVKDSVKLLSILSRRDNLIIFMLADSDSNDKGLEAKSSTIEKTGISKKVYYTRLKQLINAGLVEKSDGAYKHTTLGKIIYQKHILGLIEELKNIKQMKMVDILTHTKQFSEDEIANFIRMVTGGKISIPTGSNTSLVKIEFVWTYEDMVSAMVERIQFCKNEILLASRYLNEIIINSILRKANSSEIDVKVLTDSSLVKQYFEAEGKSLKLRDNDKNAGERMNVVSNPWYPGKVSRRIANIPFSMIILDDKEIGIEVVNWNDPKNFHGVIFIKGDEYTLKIMKGLYYEIWANASFSYTNNTEEVPNNISYGNSVQNKKQHTNIQ
jgi:hypothetical protein